MTPEQMNKVYAAYLQNNRNKTHAAKQLGMDRRNYRRHLAKALKYFNDTDNKELLFPRIAEWDIETSHTISAHYGMYGINIFPDNILLPSFLICGAWKMLGEKKIYSASLLDDKKRLKNNCFDIRKLYIDDYCIIKALHEFLSNVDILIHHNGDKFDLKKFNARAIFHGFKPIGKILCIDTLKVARKIMKVESNSLNYLCTYFGIKGKISNPKGLFLRAMFCEEDAIRELVKYNERDLFPSLEHVYLKLRPYMDNHPNMNLFLEDDVCNICGSSDIEEDGSLEYSRTTVRIRYRCNSCGGLSKAKKAIKTINLR